MLEDVAPQSAPHDITQPIRTQRGEQRTSQCADTRINDVIIFTRISVRSTLGARNKWHSFHWLIQIT
jgi:hypothetical protein